MSLKDNTRETVSSAVKTSLWYLCFIFYQKWTRLSNERTVSSSNTIRCLGTIRTTTIFMYTGNIIFYFILNYGSLVEPATL